MKFISKIIDVAPITILLLNSCVELDLYNTSHPDKGAVRIVTDWEEHSEDAVLPEQYVLCIGKDIQKVSGNVNVFPVLLASGKCNLFVCNIPDGITINGSIATVNTLGDGSLEPLPGYLFSAEKELNIVVDDTLNTIVHMRQYIRGLVLVLELDNADEGRISSVSATLEGAVESFDLKCGKQIEEQTGKVIKPAFQLAEVADSKTTGRKALMATLKLAGVAVARRQVLNLTLRLNDGSVHFLVTDLTEWMENFSSSTEPLVLNTHLALPVKSGMNASITDWREINNGIINIY